VTWQFVWAIQVKQGAGERAGGSRVVRDSSWIIIVLGAIGNSVVIDSDLAVQLGDSGETGGRGTSWGEQSGEGQFLDHH
jgi:hypothetical protein